MPDFPWLEFTVSVGTWTGSGEAYPDTGFEGGLSIPAGVAREILAAPEGAKVRLADGLVYEVPAWDGAVELQGRTFRVEVVSIGHRYLLGREVLDQLHISFEFGKRVRLRFAGEA